MADTKKIDFALTNGALAELSEAIVNLNAAITAKKNELRSKDKVNSAKTKEQEAKIRILQETSSEVLNNIGGLINKLDQVLEDNGTSNHNN